MRPCRHHDQGNVGVEHAAAATIRAALAAPRRSGPQRQLFERHHLLSWGLVAELHARVGGQPGWRTGRRGLQGRRGVSSTKSCTVGRCVGMRRQPVAACTRPCRALLWRCAAQGGNVAWRRSQVCAYLGLGECDGKQLLRQLNRYGFTRQEVERALEWAERSVGSDGAAQQRQ